MDKTKKSSPPVKDPKTIRKEETGDDIRQVLVEQQSRIVNEINDNIDEEDVRRDR